MVVSDRRPTQMDFASVTQSSSMIACMQDDGCIHSRRMDACPHPPFPKSGTKQGLGRHGLAADSVSGMGRVERTRLAQRRRPPRLGRHRRLREVRRRDQVRARLVAQDTVALRLALAPSLSKPSQPTLRRQVGSACASGREHGAWLGATHVDRRERCHSTGHEDTCSVCFARPARAGRALARTHLLHAARARHRVSLLRQARQVAQMRSEDAFLEVELAGRAAEVSGARKWLTNKWCWRRSLGSFFGQTHKQADKSKTNKQAYV